jgi:hypothetical protein
MFGVYPFVSSFPVYSQPLYFLEFFQFVYDCPILLTITIKITSPGVRGYVLVVEHMLSIHRPMVQVPAPPKFQLPINISDFSIKFLIFLFPPQIRTYRIVLLSAVPYPNELRYYHILIVQYRGFHQ